MMRKLSLIVWLVCFTLSTYGQSAHQQAVEELLDVMQVGKITDRNLNENMERLRPMIAKEDVEQQERFRKVMEDTSSWKSLKKDVVKLYMEKFNQEEVEWLIAFFQTDFGKKYLRVSHEIDSELLTVMMKKADESMTRILQIPPEENPFLFQNQNNPRENLFPSVNNP